MVNSPRTLEACTRLGIDPSELYQISLEEFKQINHDVRLLSQNMIKYRYDAEERFRNETIEQVKKEREQIIKEIEEKNNEEENESITNGLCL